jgi:nucleoside phosphorylase
MTQGHREQDSGGPPAETPEEACRTLVHLLYSRRRKWEPSSGDPDGRGQLKRGLLIADYARKSLGLPPERRTVLDRLVVESFLPADTTKPWQGVPPAAEATAAADIGIVVVIREELEAVLEVFGLDDDVFETSRGGQRFYTTEVSSRHRPDRPLSVVVTAAAKAGNVEVGAPTRALVERFAPEAVLLLGTAAGVEGKVRLGDVVATDRVHYYEPGRLASPDVWQPRPAYGQGGNAYGYGLFYYNPLRTGFGLSVAHFLRALPQHLLPDGVGRAHVPEVHSVNVTIASGENVIRDGQFLTGLRQRFDNTILAADMEAFGFVRAVGERRWLIFRGVSDYGDARQWDNWKFLSSAFAALCVRDFLETYYFPPGSETY